MIYICFCSLILKYKKKFSIVELDIFEIMRTQNGFDI